MLSHVLLFPGQGSQHLGMGRFLYDDFAIAKQTFEEASDAISLDMKKLCFFSDDATLALTENTQPALLTVSIATFRVMQTLRELKLNAVAGHSVGEYAALVASNAITFSDGVRLVRKRGQLMQEAVPVGEGGMCAVIGLTPEEVLKLCAWAEKETGLTPLEPANYNSPDQIVISGNAQIIEWLRENFKPEKLGWTKKVRLIPLKVSAPFHCSMMKPAEEAMEQELSDISFLDSQWPVVQNFTSQGHVDSAELRENITRQISGAVRWSQSMELILRMGSHQFIECGCGKVLTGLLKKIDTNNSPTFNMNSLDDIRAFENSGV
jgi:[acyl-carrier-protein] S-malonyltransferase